MPIEMEQIENKIGERVFRSFLKSGLQTREACRSIPFEDDNFAIQERGFYRKLTKRLGQRLHTMGPVEPSARQQLHARLLAIDARLNAIAIQFQLVHPVLAHRR